MKKIILTLIMLTTWTYAADITGAGATFPDLLFKEMFTQYEKETAHTISYQAIGSGQGLDQLLAHKVQFAATDIPAETNHTNLTYIPITIGAVAIVYNLPQNPELRLTPEILADIFSGKIKVWNHPTLQRLNPNKPLPDLPIRVFYRQDKSGTSYLFSRYLKKSKWIGTGTTGNEDLAKSVSNTIGAIGYTSEHHAFKYNLAIAAIQNKAHHFIRPNVESIALSQSEKSTEYAYPICGLSWLVTYKNQDSLNNKQDAKNLVALLRWMTQDGQLLAEENHYAPLPETLIKKAKAELKKITYHGEILY